VSTPAPECLVRLRKATRDIHSSVEQYTDSDRLLGDSPNREHYQQFLGSHYLLHCQVAIHSRRVALIEKDSGLLDWPDCPRIQALESDLHRQALSVKVCGQAESHYQSHAFALGLVYVCEGSCIGNQRVLKALMRHACFEQWNSKAFLSTCKADFSSRWKSVLDSLVKISENSSDIDGSGYDDIERGAVAGFELYKTYWTALSANPSRIAPDERKPVQRTELNPVDL